METDGLVGRMLEDFPAKGAEHLRYNLRQVLLGRQHLTGSK